MICEISLGKITLKKFYEVFDFSGSDLEKFNHWKYASQKQWYALYLNLPMISLHFIC